MRVVRWFLYLLSFSGGVILGGLVVYKYLKGDLYGITPNEISFMPESVLKYHGIYISKDKVESLRPRDIQITQQEEYLFLRFRLKATDKQINVFLVPWPDSSAFDSMKVDKAYLISRVSNTSGNTMNPMWEYAIRLPENVNYFYLIIQWNGWTVPYGGSGAKSPYKISVTK